MEVEDFSVPPHPTAITDADEIARLLHGARPPPRPAPVTLARCVVTARALGRSRLSHDPESTSGARGGSNGPVPTPPAPGVAAPPNPPDTHACRLILQQWGKLTDDDLEQARGQRDQLLGKILEHYGEPNDEVSKTMDKLIASR